MRVLVTGAAGFIGSAVSAELSLQGHVVRGLDNFSDYYSIGLKDARVQHFLTPNYIDCVNVDLDNRELIVKEIRDFAPDSIIHLGAQAGVRLQNHQIWRYTSSNLSGFTNILESAISENVSNFLYASSSSVYGDSSPTPYSERNEKLTPNSFYGATKLFNEISTPTLVKNSNTRARGLRFFTVYGPWGRPDMAYFRMISNVLTNSPFDFFGDGSIERDFTYVRDATEIVCSLMNELTSHNPGFSDVVNVGGGRPMSMNFLSNLIEELTGNKLNYKRAKAKSEDVTKTMADPTYLLELINSKPLTRLEQGISETIDWARTVPQEILVNWVASSQ